MGEEPLSSNYADIQHGSSILTSLLPPLPHSNGTSHPSHNDVDEPYTIRCICGFEDDDGHTVLCEQCETWQHIECYYYPDLTVPDIHQCIHCSPRHLDALNAAQRQKRRLREALNSPDDRKPKRNASKTHKRTKTKDPLSLPSTHQLNGTLVNDPASRSPRDQPPPSKRPKTNHKASGSVTAITTNSNHNHTQIHNHGGHPRNTRSGSVDAPLASPTKPPLAECPPDYFSPEFIRVHRENADFSPAQANLFLNIGISDLLSTWLDDSDAFRLATNGKSHAEVFKLQPTPIEEFETPVKKYIREDPSARFHGGHPIWPYLVADRDILEGHFVGELIGSIGHIQDYKADPFNDWDRLRHPSHFVFFHPHLPIYIDCRSEGTILRYARRSCRPNVKIETLITGARDLHFCFVATTDIPQGAEITLAWDVESDPQMRDYLNRLSTSASSVDNSHREYISRFIGTVLAHFGDCACEQAYDDPCIIGRFDRRLDNLKPVSSNLPTQKKKPPARRSPPGAQSRGGDVDSRAASETIPQENGEDMGEAISSPHSSHSPTSREQSPALYDAPVRMGPELSERDKRKLVQSEKLFQKIKLEAGQRGKKKRRSGSALQTPTAPLMNQSGRSYFSASSTPAPSSRARVPDNGHSDYPSPAVQSSAENSPQAESPLPNARPVPSSTTTKPPYTNASMQTEEPGGWGDPLPSPPANGNRVSYVPLSQRLLRRNHLAQKWSLREPTQRHPLPCPIALQHATQTDSEALSQPIHSMVVEDVELSPTTIIDQTRTDFASLKVDKDTPPLTPMEPITGAAENAVGPPLSISIGEPPDSPSKVETRVTTDAVEKDGEPQRNNFRSTKLHVDLPPRQFPPLAESGPSTVSAAMALSGTSELSPRTLGSLPPMSAPIATMSAPLMTPTQSSLTQPSPAKKKMSLSDYSQRLKAKTPVMEKTPGQAHSGFVATSSLVTQSLSDVNTDAGDQRGSSPFEGTGGSTVKTDPDVMEP